jgi:uncharacterized repeat protein (TIGR01451 family)
MKRLFLRISALVALVVLGCIAIAQAQRGVDTSKAADPVLPASSGSSPDQNASLPGLLPAAPSPTPQPLLGADEGNPLRDSRNARTHDVAAEPLPAGSGTLAPAAAAPRFAPSQSDPFRGRTVENSLRPQPLPGVSLNAQLTAQDNPVPAHPPVGRGLASEPAQSASRVTAASNTEIPDATVLSGGTGVMPAIPRNSGETPAPPNVAPLRDGGGMPSLGREPPESFGRAAHQETQLAQYSQPSSPVDRLPAAPSQRDEPAALQFDPRSTPAKLPAPFTTAQNDAGMPSLGNGPIVEQSSPMEGTGRPGMPQLDGPQTPQLVIQKSVTPSSIRVGKPATFRLTVANRGQVAAQGVEIHDQVPQGTQLITTMPRASRGAGGEMVWSLGTLKPGDEVAVEMQLLPKMEGEIGSVATVHFAAEASARTVVTKPALTIKTTMPNRVMIGDPVPVSVTVCNPGSGEATGVVLKERVPAGLECPAGNDLVYEIGPLKAGETRQIQLPLTATKGGRIVNVLSAEGEDNLKAEDRAEVEVIAPQLDVALEGPKRRYLERQAVYTLSVSNPGTAPARGVELVAYLPPGLKFVSANNGGGLDAGSQTVHWLLGELPIKETGKVELVTMPVEAGQQKLRLEGRGEQGLAAAREQPIAIEGLAAVMFQVTNTSGPIEVGSETAYEIRVANQGSKEATNVRIVALLPPGMRAVAAEGPTRYALDPNRVQFESLAQLAPKAETTYRVRVQGLQPGDLRIRVQLQTDEMQEPVTKEESARVYANE